MLYHNLITNKIIRILRFRKEGSIDRCQYLVPDLIRQYAVPKDLRRDVYFNILTKWFHGLREEEIERLLNEAYPVN